MQQVHMFINQKKTIAGGMIVNSDKTLIILKRTVLPSLALSGKSVHPIHQRHLLQQALRALSHRVVSVVHWLLLRPRSMSRVRVRVAYPAVIGRRGGISGIARVSTVVENVVRIERVRCRVPIKLQ
jgi:hypothetical protein